MYTRAKCLKTEILFFLVCILVLTPSVNVFAAQGVLYLSPESGIYAVGNTFTIKVFADSGDEEINAAEAELTFNPDELFVENISTEESILNLWTAPPSFSNETGIIEFAGGTQESFIGNDGLLLSITFRALKSITSNAFLAAGAILAADGKGSNIITSMKSGVYTLEPRKIIAQAEYIAREDTPLEPIISSSTHPDENTWYKEKIAQFSWAVPEDVTAVRLLVNNIPESLPSVLYEPSVADKVVKDLKDGIWYFHAQMKNKNGWGRIAHFRLQIDTEKPESLEIIKQRENADKEGSQPQFFLDAVDVMSGIEKYEIKIDQEKLIIWNDDGSHVYNTPPLVSGEHTLLVKAIDKAGNYLLDSISFTVKSIEAPVLTEYPDVINIDDLVIIKGITLPNSRVSVFLQKGGEIPERDDIMSGDDGSFTFIASKKPKEGIYRAWTEVYRDSGAKSIPSEKITFAVEPPMVIEITSFAIKVLSVFIPLIALLIILGILAGYIWYRLEGVKRRILKKEKKQ